ncbi:MAG: hypothetical protein AABZ74_16615 [Cyanobacteriota bacterium]
MLYENIKGLIEEKFSENYFTEKQKISAFDKWDKIYPLVDSFLLSDDIIYLASISFFVFDEFNETRNFRHIADDFEIDPKVLALKVKEIAPYFNDHEPIQNVLKKGLLINEKSRKQTKDSKIISDETFIISIKHFKAFIASIFPEKDFFEIKTFIKLFNLNLSMSGYNISLSELEKKFGDLFIHLSFEPKKGREPDKFVNLKDRFGNYEPYTLIKLGE